MSKNAYLQKRNQDRQAHFNAGFDMAAQQMFDIMCLVLNDPQIMGKGTFGAERLKKLHQAVYQREAQYHEAWTDSVEADYYQEKLDEGLRRIFGKIDPFPVRYPWAKEEKYGGKQG